MNKVLTNAFLASFLVAITIDALPSMSLLHDRMKALIDPVLDKTGLWQESWRLFAPDVDKMNSAVSAEIRYQDGQTVEWRSPEWNRLSRTDRFLRFREIAFYDRIKNDSNRGAWRSFAQYIATLHVRDDGVSPHEISFKRHWVDIPAPRPRDHQPRQALPLNSDYEFYVYKVESPKS